MQNKEIWEKRHRNSIGIYTRVTEFARICFSNYLSDKKGDFLDLACGKGADSIFFHYKGFKVTAVDYSSEAINQFNYIQNKKNIFIKSLAFDITKKLPFENNQFNYVYSRLGLNYFDNKTTKSIISEIKRILKSEGLLMFQVKSTKDCDYGKGENIEKDLYNKNGYIRRFFDQKYANKILKGFRFEYLEEKILDNGHAYLNVVAKKK